ncbi:MAG: MFS transporter [Dehalococcoidia bacterium]
MASLIRRLHLLPASATADARVLVLTRASRGFADGLVAVLLASYLKEIGFSNFEIGVLITGTLLGSAFLTLASGFLAARVSRRRVLLLASGLMFLTGLGFASFTDFWPLLLVAVLGTVNPSAADVSVFLPTEQALLPDTVNDRDRTALFARHNLAGRLMGAFGALASGLPVIVAEARDWDLADTQRLGFLVYAAVAVGVTVMYTRLSPNLEKREPGKADAPLKKSRRTVFRLAALFSLDSAAGGLVVDSILALWLFNRFDFSTETVAAIFFGAGLLLAFSQLVSPWLAARVGLINTMVFTHLPANFLLILAALMPVGELAVACLLLRMLFAQMDVPARQSYVTSVVPREERAAAASVTNVPRSLAQAGTPVIAGLLLSQTDFGWPLIIAGLGKATYDILLLIQFRALKPPEEGGAAVDAD